ncbi:MAG: DinB family protein [Gemmatimonadales bacterium]
MRTLSAVSLSITLLAGLAPSAPAQAAPTGVRADLLTQLDDAATKIAQLASAIPPEKYSWRPGAGVRSISEVVMHVTGANYYIPTFAGVRASVQLPRDAETTITDKAQIAGHLNRSFEHVRAALRAFADADLDKPTTMFGSRTTNRNVWLTIVTHAHEHLGQLIAYARSNGIVPPWSMGSGQ